VTAVLVALGGALGAVLRYWIGTAVQGALPLQTFPLGTLVVNVSGCFVMGLVTGLEERHGCLTAEWRAFVAVGVLGGFTTFSAFANETVGAVRAGAALVGAVNVVASVALCLLAVVAGRLTAGLWPR
jgi:fluoride exporter